jgi:uncharacterized protein
MNRRDLLLALSAVSLTGRPGLAQVHPLGKPDPDAPPGSPPTILLRDYHPESIFRTPKTNIEKAKYPVIDAHCHGPHTYNTIATQQRDTTPGPTAQLDDWVKTMDAVGVERTVIFTGASTPERFSELRKSYDKYPGRFDLWCTFNGEPGQTGFGPHSLESLEGCHRAGARGVGELSDKGLGLIAPSGTGPPPAGVAATPGPHADDASLDPLWEKCAQLGMPVNIHISDPIWAYQSMDATNDGLMVGWLWEIDQTRPGLLGHNQLIESLEGAVKKHPKTIFIACHFANLTYDLTRLGQMLDRNPNLFADLSARCGEIAPIPRFASQFIQKYQDRVLYGTDYPYSLPMFRSTFRILESNDEHYYQRDVNNYNYHWALNGLGLPNEVLKKIYHDNALKVFEKAQNNAA